MSVEAQSLISSLLTVADKALKNKWFGEDDEELSQKDLGQNLEESKKFTAQRKSFKKLKNYFLSNFESFLNTA